MPSGKFGGLFGLYCRPFGIPGVEVDGGGVGFVCTLPHLLAYPPTLLVGSTPSPPLLVGFILGTLVLVCRLTRHCVKFMYRAQVGVCSLTSTVAPRWPWWFTHHCRHCELFCTFCTCHNTLSIMLEISTALYWGIQHDDFKPHLVVLAPHHSLYCKGTAQSAYSQVAGGPTLSFDGELQSIC